MAKSLLDDRWTLWIVAAVTILLFVIANLPWHLDNYDQAKQAFTSFEMIKEGRWFYQQTPTSPEQVATKPPLVGWISAGLFTLTGSWDMAWRLPSFLAAIAMAILLLALPLRLRKDCGRDRAQHVRIKSAESTPGDLVRTDMPLALVIFLIGIDLAENSEGTVEILRSSLHLALLTAAMLIKGPTVYAFLLPGIGV
jgi:4-amino-4-deoxy-L-arabinose transferase-like glycosyltransferase